jgi:WWE domain/Right handed beta helix region
MADPPVEEEIERLDVVSFPNEDGTNFEEACHTAAESHRPLHLLQDILHLSDVIILRQRQQLTIRGPSTTSHQRQSGRRIKITGNTHSLFLLNNHSRLILTDVDLVHGTPNDEDCRRVGAAINLRYKGSVTVRRSTIVSESGFCCWAVQNAHVELDQCTLRAPLRSALVCFGRAGLEAESCLVESPGVHGICARGRCTIRATRTRIVGAAVRGLYAYADAHVTLEDCTVSGTVRPDGVAIEVTSSSSCAAQNGGTRGDDDPAAADHSGGETTTAAEASSSSSLVMRNCRVIDNASVGIRLRGNVRHNDLVNNWSCSGNVLARNGGSGDVDCVSWTTFGDGELRDKENSSDAGVDSVNRPPRRDASGSSFRKGDWWCPVCLPKRVVPGSRESCLVCRTRKNLDHLLTNADVIRMNQGGLEIPEAQKDSATPAAQNDEVQIPPTWWFDGEGGSWIRYDAHSTNELEATFQLHSAPPCDSIGVSPIVHLSEGRYRVNVQTMQQINTETHFPRLVRRLAK